MKSDLKYELIEKLVLTEDEAVLQQVKELLEGNATFFWNELAPKLKESINRGLEQSDNNIGFSHDESMKQARARLQK
ncbi:MAG TPA: hypothetical protein VIT44_11155 [Cyclobacteriaceae bacterium]